jgi:hypothetical protein
VVAQHVELFRAEAVSDDRVEAVLVQIRHHVRVELIEVDADRKETAAVDGDDAVGIERDIRRTGRRRGWGG